LTEQPIEGGRLYVEVTSDASGFRRELQDKLNAEVRGIRAKIKAEVQGQVEFDRAQIRRELATKLAQAAREIKVKVSVEADLTRAREEMTRFRREQERQPIRPPVRPEPDNRRLRDIAKKMKSFGEGLTKVMQPTFMVTGYTLAAGAALNLAGGLAAVATSAAQAAGVGAALPGIYATAGQAMGAVKLGISGIGDAVKQLEAEANKKAGLTPLQQAMANLSPEGRKLAKTIQGTVMPQFKALRFSVQDAIVPGLRQAIRNAMPLLGTLRKGLTDTGARAGVLADDFTRLAASPGFRRDLRTVMASNNRAFSDFGQAGIYLVDALRHVMVVASPLVERIAALAKHAALLADREARAGRESGRMADFFERAWATAVKLGGILGDVAVGLFNVFRLSRPTGDDALDSLADAAERFRAATEDPANQERIRKFFEDTAPLMRQVGDLLVRVTQLFLRLGEATGGGTFDGIFLVLNAVVTLLEKIASMPGGGQVLSTIFLLAGAGAGLGIVSKSLSGIVKNLGTIAKFTGASKLFELIRGGGEEGGGGGPLERLRAGWDKVKEGFDRLKQGVTDARAALGRMRDTARQAATQARDALRTAGQKVRGGVQAAGRGIQRGAAATGRGIQRGATAAGRGIQTGAQAAGRTLVAAGRATGSAIASGARAAGRGLAAAGRAAGRGAAAAGRGARTATVAVGRGAAAGATAAARALSSAARAGALAARNAALFAANMARAGARAAAAGVRAAASAMASAATAAARAAVSVGATALAYVRAGAAAALAAARTVLYRTVTLAVRAATIAWTAVQWLLNTALSANPLGLIVLAIAALVAGVILAYKKVGWFRDGVNAIFGFLKTAVVAAINFVRDHWRLILVVLLGPLGLAVALVTKYWRQIYNAVAAAIGWVLGFVTSHWRLLVTILLGPLGLAVALVTKYWRQIYNAVAAAVGWVVGFVRDHWRLLVSIVGGPLVAIVVLVVKYWGQIRSKISAALSAISARVKAGLAAVRAIAQSILSAITGVFSRAWSSVTSRTSSLAASLRSKISGLMNSLRSSFSNGVSAMARAWDRLRDATKKPINAFIGFYNRGVVDMWNRVMGWLHVSGMHLGRVGYLARGGTLADPLDAVPMVTNRPTAIVGEGRPSHPEFVIPTDPRYRGRARALWAAAGSKLDMLAGGGILGGVLGGIKKAAGKVLDIGKAGLELIANPGKIWDRLAGPLLAQARGAIGDSPYAQVIAAIPKKLLDTAKGAAMQIVKAFKAGFGGGGNMGVVNAARTQIGVPYVWGGTSWGHGLDCSGLTQGAWRHGANKDITRTTYTQRGYMKTIPGPRPGAVGQPHPGHTYLASRVSGGRTWIVEAQQTGTRIFEHLLTRNTPWWGWPPGMAAGGILRRLGDRYVRSGDRGSLLAKFLGVAGDPGGVVRGYPGPDYAHTTAYRRDSGGPLPPGTWAFNGLSGTEWVLTPEAVDFLGGDRAVAAINASAHRLRNSRPAPARPVDTGAAQAGAAAQVNVYPQPRQSETEIGMVAARKIGAMLP
jgi:hypothetical protein